MDLNTILGPDEKFSIEDEFHLEPMDHLSRDVQKISVSAGVTGLADGTLVEVRTMIVNR